MKTRSWLVVKLSAGSEMCDRWQGFDIQMCHGTGRVFRLYNYMHATLPHITLVCSFMTISQRRRRHRKFEGTPGDISRCLERLQILNVSTTAWNDTENRSTSGNWPGAGE